MQFVGFVACVEYGYEAQPDPLRPTELVRQARILQVCMTQVWLQTANARTQLVGQDDHFATDKSEDSLRLRLNK